MTQSNGTEGSEDEDDEKPDAFELPPRIIRPAHFNAAFEQVTATCSRDMASVQQLRSWAAKFSRNSSALYGTTPTSSTTAPPTNGRVRPRELRSVNPTGANSPIRGMSNVDDLLSKFSTIQSVQKGTW
jgi:hypothetical protein